MARLETLAERTERQFMTNKLFEDPDSINVVCGHMANGGDLPMLAKIWGIRYSDLTNWLRSDPERNKRYEASLHDADQWRIAIITRELQRFGLSDIRELFNDQGAVRPTSEWSDELTSAISSMEVNELWEGTGRDRRIIGEIKKIKLVDKIKPLELLGKQMRMFLDRVEHSGKLSIEDLIGGSMTDEEKKKP